jgi:hypothetical protein
MHAKHDPREVTKAATAANPGSLAYWLREVDPEKKLPAAERRRRAGHLRDAYMAELARRSIKARRLRREAAAKTKRGAT